MAIALSRNGDRSRIFKLYLNLTIYTPTGSGGLLAEGRREIT